MLDRVTLAHFRNHPDTRLDGAVRFNLLIGENGAGKTNVLEAISLLAPGKGLRRAALTDMALEGGPGGFAVSAALAQVAGEPVQIGTATLPGRPGRRIVQVNSAECPAVALGEWLAIGWLTPAMDRLFSDTPGARRRFLDRLVLAREPGHARNAARAETALRERNRLLSSESEPDPAWLDAIEGQLAEAGAEVSAARGRMVASLSEALAVLPEAPFARPLLAYLPGGPSEREALTAAMAESRRRDRAAQRSLIGPHRDELGVTMVGKGQPASECSTGEQKAMLIAITLAHAGLLDGERPQVLLLDEVAAHLDPLRREALFERLASGRAQVWMTGTERAPFSALGPDTAIWRVAGGEAERLG